MDSNEISEIPLLLPSCRIARAEGAWGIVFIGGEVKDSQVSSG